MGRYKRYRLSKAPTREFTSELNVCKARLDVYIGAELPSLDAHDARPRLGGRRHGREDDRRLALRGDAREVEQSATPGRAARKATLSLRFGEVTILRPDGKDMKHLPKTVTLRLVEAVERDPPAGVEPIHWRLLTTHAVDDVAMAWQIVDWYRLRWIIDIDQTWRLQN